MSRIRTLIEPPEQPLASRGPPPSNPSTGFGLSLVYSPSAEPPGPPSQLGPEAREPEAEGLGEMGGEELRLPRQVGDRAGHAQGAVHPAHREAKTRA